MAFEPINLDCCYPCELELIVQSQDYPVEIREYARLALISTSARLAGRIADAINTECSMNRLYCEMPDEYRW